MLLLLANHAGDYGFYCSIVLGGLLTLSQWLIDNVPQGTNLVIPDDE